MLLSGFVDAPMFPDRTIGPGFSLCCAPAACTPVRSLRAPPTDPSFEVDRRNSFSRFSGDNSQILAPALLGLARARRFAREFSFILAPPAYCPRILGVFYRFLE